jgi:lipoate---protein ligase
MFIEPGNTITYSIYASQALVAGLSFVESYAFLDAWVVDALQSLGVNAWYQPINDITSSGGKIGGAAQTRRAGAVLHHVTMAYDIDSAKMLEVLRIGREKLSDKGRTSAAKRVDPVRAQTGVSRTAVIDRMVETFQQEHGLTPSALTPAELSAAEELMASKFATDEWLYILP